MGENFKHFYKAQRWNLEKEKVEDTLGNGHVWMWELDCEESWAPKNWCFWTVVLEKTLESPLDCKEIQPVHSKGDQPWNFFGRNDAKAETPVFWPPHAKSWLTGKDSDAGRDWGQEKGMHRGWDGWMASRTPWAWVWVNSGSWWWTGRPDMLQFMGSQRVGHDWVTELNELKERWTKTSKGKWGVRVSGRKMKVKGEKFRTEGDYTRKRERNQAVDRENLLVRLMIQLFWISDLKNGIVHSE